MKVRQRIKRLPRLTYMQQMAQHFRPVGFLKQRRPQLSGGIGRIESFRFVESGDL